MRAVGAPAEHSSTEHSSTGSEPGSEPAPDSDSGRV